MIIPALHPSEHLLSQHQLLDQMEGVMPDADITQFLQVVQTHPSDTLWDTMVNTFGYTKGNIYTNHLMDTRWRISDDSTTSELFQQAFHGNFPVSSEYANWDTMMTFLTRIYNYDNLQNYTVLLDQPWLSQTLIDLKSGAMSVDQFGQLSLEQREIVTQALFYHMKPDSLQQLFDGLVTMPDVILPDPVIVHSGNVMT